MMYRGLLQWVAPIAALALTTLFALATVRVGSNVGAVPELAIAALILWAASLLQPDLLRTALPTLDPRGPRRRHRVAVAREVQYRSRCARDRPRRGRRQVTEDHEHRVADELDARFVPRALAGGSAVARRPHRMGATIDSNRSRLFLQPGVAGRCGRCSLLAAVVRRLRSVARRALATGAGRTAFAPSRSASWSWSQRGSSRRKGSLASIRTTSISRYLGVGVLIVAIGHRPRWRALSVLGLVVASGAIITASGYAPVGASAPRTCIATATGHRRGGAHRPRLPLIRPIAQARFKQPHRGSERTITFRQAVVSALDHRDVHADPSAIAAIWAYGLALAAGATMFQSYQANTPALDDANARSLRSSDGPRRRAARSCNAYSLERLSAWESPDYMVTLTCGFRVTSEGRGWQALVRIKNACGDRGRSARRWLATGRPCRAP